MKAMKSGNIIYNGTQCHNCNGQYGKTYCINCAGNKPVLVIDQAVMPDCDRSYSCRFARVDHYGKCWRRGTCFDYNPEVT